MKRLWCVATTVTCVLALAPAGAASGAPAAAAGWGTAQNIPGLLALNQGGGAGVTGLSCGAPGDCGVGGWYSDANGDNQAFVAIQAGGRWGAAEEVPGTAALNAGGAASVTALACPAAGECTAVGSYTTRSRAVRSFTVTEADGVWGTARPLPAAPGRHRHPVLDAVACAAPGQCSAGGTDGEQAFAVTATGGRWGAPRPVPGLGPLNTGRFAEVTTISCAAPGHCGAGGTYTGRTGRFRPQRAFVVSQRHGVWGHAEPVPGLAALTKGQGQIAEVTAMSCAAPGDCSAVGGYQDNTRGFVVTQAHGVWGNAEEVPGTGAYAGAVAVSCGAPGYCGAGGTASLHQAMVADQADGVWGRARQVATGINAGRAAGIKAVSCAAPGDCGAGGSYTDLAGHVQAFVLTEAAGRWGRAEEVPGSQVLNTAGDAEVTAISCAAPGRCTAAGSYATGHSDSPPGEVFVVSRP
jgi:hypothetical protein